MARWEVGARILVDAEDEAGAHEKALALGPTLDAFFSGVTVAAVEWPQGCEEDREAESLSEHAESLQSAAGLS